jgi:hypothetical protein
MITAPVIPTAFRRSRGTAGVAVGDIPAPLVHSTFGLKMSNV